MNYGLVIMTTWACKIRALLHIKFGLVFELQLITTPLNRLSYRCMSMKCSWCVDKSIRSEETLQGLFIINSDPEKYHFLNLLNCADMHGFTRPVNNTFRYYI